MKPPLCVAGTDPPRLLDAQRLFLLRSRVQHGGGTAEMSEIELGEMDTSTLVGGDVVQAVWIDDPHRKIRSSIVVKIERPDDGGTTLVRLIRGSGHGTDEGLSGFREWEILLSKQESRALGLEGRTRLNPGSQTTRAIIVRRTGHVSNVPGLKDKIIQAGRRAVAAKIRRSWR